jgi:hypothetical protein
MEENKNRIFDTFIIGVQKAGTTYLKYLLSQHPGITTHSTTEFSYYHDPLYHGKIGVQGFLKEHFKENIFLCDKKVLGKNVGLFTSQVALKRLIDDNKGVKIIIVLREPIARVFSAYNFCFSRGVEKNNNFSRAIREENRYKNDAFRQRNCNYVDASLYSKQLDRIFNIVGKENIRIINFSDLKNEPNEVSKNIFKFMGLKSHTISLRKSKKVVNGGVVARFPKLNSIFIIKNSWVNKLWKKLPSEFRSKFLAKFGKLNSINKSTKNTISNADRTYLIEVFKADLKNLKSKYDIDFSLKS